MSEDDAITLLDALDLAARTVRDHEYGLGIPFHQAEQLRNERLDAIQSARLAVRELRGT